MAKNVFDLHRELDTWLNQRAYFRTRQQKDDALNFASRGLFGHYYGNIEAYAPDKPLPPVAYAVTQNVNDVLRPFERSITYSSAAGTPAERLIVNGRFPLPASIVHPTAITTPDALQGIKVTPHDRKVLARNNPRLPPTRFAPLLTIAPATPAASGVAAFIGGYDTFPFATSVTVDYLGFPTLFHYATTLVDFEEVYDDANSVDSEWTPLAYNQLITRATEYLALAVRDAQVANAASAKTQKGD